MNGKHTVAMWPRLQPLKIEPESAFQSIRRSDTPGEAEPAAGIVPRAMFCSSDVPLVMCFVIRRADLLVFAIGQTILRPHIWSHSPEVFFSRPALPDLSTAFGNLFRRWISASISHRATAFAASSESRNRSFAFSSASRSSSRSSGLRFPITFPSANKALSACF